MNPKTTFWLAAIAIALFGYIYFVDLQPSRSPGRQPQVRKLLPNFDPSQVTSVEVTCSNQTIRAHLANDRWQLSNPPYPAQATAIESFLEVLTQLNRQNEIPAHEIISQSGGLSPFGLDPPWATIKLQLGTNLVQFRVGAKTLLGDRVYVQPVGASGIFTTDGALLKHLPANASQWRNPMLIQAGELAFDHIGITAGSRPLQLERDPGNQLWRLVEPMPTRADFGRVEYLIQQLRSARVSQFVTDDPKQEVEAYGLQTPVAELTLASGSNVVFQVQFGGSPTNDPTRVYARCWPQSNVVLVTRELADLAEKPYTEFRDRAVLTFRPSLVHRIDVHADEIFTLERLNDQDWGIVQPFRAPADPQLMQLFLQDLANLEIIRFEKDVVADFAPYALVKPARQYLLQTTITNGVGSTNQPLVQVDFGTHPTNELDKVYCRRSDESSVYLVAFADMLKLERAAYTLRDRRIWHFASSNVTAVTIQQRGQKRELLRDPGTHKWDRENPVRHAAIEETLFRLGQLQAESWSAQGQHEAELRGVSESKHQLVLSLKQEGQPHKLTLTFGNLAPSGQPYAAVVLEQDKPVVFKFPVPLYALIAQYLSIASGSSEP